jgi:DNA invertase Pin-like site-specific DNA recombinase
MPTMRSRKQKYPLPAKLLEPVKRAAAYVRMSTDHQKYSTTNQLAAIQEYAAGHSLMVCRTYADEGISGLNIKNRPGLRKLISDILRGTADFDMVLVYDITRWGRFQDIDDSAFYEVLCRRNGVDIVYCAEAFQNDRSPLTAVIKAIRRAEAANFSRDLSAKVFNGQCNLARRGYSQGGPAPYGLSNVVVRDDGKPLRRVTRHKKRLDGYHVELVPGPKDEVRTVREIFRRYVKLGETTGQIAAFLNSRGIPTRFGRQWRSYYIGNMYLEEKYIGTAIYNRVCSKLLGKCRLNDPSEWIRKPNAFPAIIRPSIFEKARIRRQEEMRFQSDDEILVKLRRFISKHRRVTHAAMQKSGNGNLSYQCVRRFGSLLNAFDLIGHRWTSQSAYWQSRMQKNQIREEALDKIGRTLGNTGIEVFTSTYGRFWVADQPCYFEASRTKRDTETWLNHCKYNHRNMIYVVARMNKDGKTIRDYYVVPRVAIATMPVTLHIKNRADVDAYRATNIEEVAQLIAAWLEKLRPWQGLMLPRIAR